MRKTAVKARAYAASTRYPMPLIWRRHLESKISSAASIKHGSMRTNFFTIEPPVASRRASPSGELNMWRLGALGQRRPIAKKIEEKREMQATKRGLTTTFKKKLLRLEIRKRDASINNNKNGKQEDSDLLSLEIGAKPNSVTQKTRSRIADLYPLPDN
ncbi:hypothetical protein ACS0TY_005074 [Phlomoides rotata]